MTMTMNMLRSTKMPKPVTSATAAVSREESSALCFVRCALAQEKFSTERGMRRERTCHSFHHLLRACYVETPWTIGSIGCISRMAPSGGQSTCSRNRHRACHCCYRGSLGVFEGSALRYSKRIMPNHCLQRTAKMLRFLPSAEG